MPGVFFYKFLAKRADQRDYENRFDQLKINLPDTVVYYDH